MLLRLNTAVVIGSRLPSWHPRGRRTEKREVTLGLEEGDFVEAIAGVETGEQVIILGQGGLKNGSEIEILTPTGEEIRES